MRKVNVEHVIPESVDHVVHIVWARYVSREEVYILIVV